MPEPRRFYSHRSEEIRASAGIHTGQDLHVPLNHTHDPKRPSWVTTAADPHTDFSLQNLPWGVFRRQGLEPRGGVAIGDCVFDLAAALASGLFRGSDMDVAHAAARSDLREFLSLGNAAASALRSRVFELLAEGGERANEASSLRDKLLVPLDSVELMLPLAPGSFTDFCSSLHHIRRMGRGRPTHPAWDKLPVAYNGRASSVRASGSPVQRPRGQFAQPGSSETLFGPEPMLDFELELGAWLNQDTTLGEPITVEAASRCIFGYCLVNDWSARAIQFFEMALGPFLGKSFLTTISPWIVSEEALAPFRTDAPRRESGEPPVPQHLHDAPDGGIAIGLEATLQTAAMRASGAAPHPIVRTNTRHLHWTFAQMIAHQASNGCSLGCGDLVACGTVSGPEDISRACLAEHVQPLALPGGESRSYLQDGDEVALSARAIRDGYASIGFGTCAGKICAAK